MPEDESLSGSGQIALIRNADIELRFWMRTDISEALSKSISEHGVLVPP